MEGIKNVYMAMGYAALPSDCVSLFIAAAGTLGFPPWSKNVMLKNNVDIHGYLVSSHNSNNYNNLDNNNKLYPFLLAKEEK